MNYTNVKISIQMFKTIVEVGKMMKSTFIVYDPENPMRLYGFNGIGYEWNGETKLGCMKYLDQLEYIDMFLRRPESKYPVHGFVCYVKDLYAASKLLDESNLLNNNEIILIQRVYSDNANDITSIEVRVNGELAAMIPTFKINKFKDIYNRLITNLNTVNELDITEDDEMIQLLGTKAADGAQHLLYNNIPMYLTANMLNVNKGDRIIASHTEESNPRVVLKVIKKKYTITTIFKILSL